MDTGIAFAAVTTRNEGIKVTGKIGFSSHPMIEHFKFLKAHTTRTPKMTIPAPSALYGRPIATPVDKSIYPNNEKMFDDLGQAYKKAVRAFAMPAAATCSSTRSSSPCCAIRITASR